MQIAGIQKLTLIDFPGHVAATVFTRGCSFRCPFCHNPELVIPEQYLPLIDEKQLYEFLEKRYGKLTGLCITGGEPLLQTDIEKFIPHMKALGFDIKLDTNGSFPDKLKRLIKAGDLDYVAMDIKSPLDKYKSVAGVGDAKEKIKKSIKLIMESKIDYEFRTTVCHPLHELSDFEEIGKMIEGAQKYCIQNFRQSKQIDQEQEFLPFSDAEIAKIKKIMKKYVRQVEVR